MQLPIDRPWRLLCYSTMHSPKRRKNEKKRLEIIQTRKQAKKYVF